MNKSVGVLIVNFNGAADTVRCLEKLALSKNAESIVACVVDNSCSDGEWESLILGTRNLAVKDEDFGGKPTGELKNPPEFVLIGSLLVLFHKAPKNGGFAYGCNRARDVIANHFVCDYWLLLNNDAFVNSTAVVSMRDTLAAHPDCKMCGAVIWDYPDIGKVQAVGGVCYSEWTGRGRNLNSGMSSNEFFGKYSSRQYGFGVSYISGACLMIRAKAWDAVGGMSERYFLYGEELDFAYRMKELDGSVIAYRANVYHKVGSSIGTGKNKSLGSRLSEFYLARSKTMICISYRPSRLFGMAAFLMLRSAKGMVRGEFSSALAVIRGMVSGISVSLREKFQ